MKCALGDFELKNFNKSYFVMRTIIYLMLSFIGAILLTPIEIIDNLSKMLKLPALIFGG